MDLETHIFNGSFEGRERDLGRSLGLLALVDEMVVGLEPGGKLQIIEAQILAVVVSQPVLELFKLVELLLEEAHFEVCQLGVQIEIDISLIDQVDIGLGQLLEEVGEFEEEEDFPTVHGILLVEIVDLEGVFAGVLGFGEVLLGDGAARHEAAALALLEKGLLA